MRFITETCKFNMAFCQGDPNQSLAPAASELGREQGTESCRSAYLAFTYLVKDHCQAELPWEEWMVHWASWGGW